MHSKKAKIIFFNISIFLGLLANVPLDASVKNKNSCHAFYSISQSLLQVKNPHDLTIKVDGNKSVLLPSENPYYDRNLTLKPIAEALSEILTTRTADEQIRIDNELTRLVGSELGMGFKTKDGNPFHVRVNGLPALIKESDFNSTIKGIQPVLKRMRHILQVFTSNPKAKPADYNLKYLSQEEIYTIIEAIKTSPYLDEAINNPKMKNYPFGSVFGIDATFGNLEHHLSHIFEINAGTPSGLSNTTMIIEAIRRMDPKLYSAIVKMSSTDNQAFSLLKKVMDDIGRSFIPDGISVELGVGIYSGAHPDMAMISHFSGMPLTLRKDLFIDKDYHVRLAKKLPIKNGKYHINGKEVQHVGDKAYEGYLQVWSIYSRAEEGFALQTPAQKDKDGIGYKTPETHKINADLNTRFGLNLKSGTAYKYIYAMDGITVTGVEKDAQGRPKLDDSFDQFSPDPIDQVSDRSLIESIHHGKVYLSNLGTRLIDHKGILSLVTKDAQLEAIHKQQNPDKTIVSPPQELRTNEERTSFFKNPRNYIVKVPDESGGVGVYILPTASSKTVKEVTENVRNNPNQFVIQSLADFMSIIAASKVDNQTQWATRANDGRIFVYLDLDGNTISHPRAKLVRVADAGKLSTNTSQGAQYGLISTLQDINPKLKSRPVDITKSSLPKSQVDFITSDQSFHLKDYLISINMIKNQSYLSGDKHLFLQNFWNSARTLMSVLGPDFSFMIDVIELAQKNEISDNDLKTKVISLERKLRTGTFNPNIKTEINQLITETLDENK
ncbi:MAG: circularly permuted type 2 ATP-grasp protein [Bdellovibrionaceae bacterium]|nr:circularly permuted type 2 ATP-grasp protein [Pseudobdellovibrionaceae bacterium]NUM58693.1 circularly permuted type 2 ATP-grasp protein [Pseudobdellovibrionaceae bacterium]